MAFQRLALPLVLFTTVFLPTCVLGGLVQKQGLKLPDDAPASRQLVKDIFVKSYKTYREVAFGHDDLSPLSSGFSDGRNGWGATVVDAMSTMHIMGLDDFFQEAVSFSSKIDFSKSQTPDTISVFESTIRYMGGLLSAYELSGQTFPGLVDKAKELAEKLSVAWVGDNAIPYGHIDFEKNQPSLATSNIAEAGTLILEWSTLSKYTGDEKYRDLADRAMKHMIQLAAPLPGLPAQGIDPKTGNAVGAYVTWGGGSDSFFEYEIKYARLTGFRDAIFAQAWLTAVDSSIKHLAQEAKGWLYLGDYDDRRQVRKVSSHLACFHGGNWIYGGRLLDNQTIVDYGLRLVDACWNTYASTATGIGPEVFSYGLVDGLLGGSPPSADQEAFFVQHGFYITAPDYILRPEVLESNFYAWRVTGDRKYLDRAAAAIKSFNQFLSAGAAFAGIYDVNSETSDKIDDMESFWFAEVLKYLYLTFDDPEHISLDEYVFNTEAHPFKAPPAPTYTGTRKLPPAKAPFKTQSGDTPEISPNPNLPTPLKDALGIDINGVVTGLGLGSALPKTPLTSKPHPLPKPKRKLHKARTDRRDF